MTALRDFGIKKPGRAPGIHAVHARIVFGDPPTLT